jgi:hypothetical protein
MTIHGLSKTPEYGAWRNMVRRCTHPGHPNYADYGGRGIVVCASWRESFSAFLAEVGSRPSADHEIDRVDNALGYEPGNVRWATRTEQNRNTRKTMWVTVRGEHMALATAAERFGVVDRVTVRRRVLAGWTDEDAVLRPSRGPMSKALRAEMGFT